jgi:isopentenyl diphosphate isomerase/L-lactate dehydrogenase-like FMN-dependent dehydrogenase
MSGARVWLQIYLHGGEVTRDLVQRAEAAGVRALCLTVDTRFSARAIDSSA